jgi:DNA-binding NarL/FixJ family response regulator
MPRSGDLQASLADIPGVTSDKPGQLAVLRKKSPWGQAVEGKISVLILSDNRILRESIAHILTNKRDFQVLDAEPPRSSFVAGDYDVTPDVWVSDSLQCFIDNLQRPFKRKNGQPAGCVLVAMKDDAKQFLKAITLGVLGYVLQESSAADVVAAIRGVAQGEAVCPSRLARALFDYVASHRNVLHAGRARKQFRLTRREQQLIPLVDRGLTNKEIAAQLSVSEQTIKSHIHRMLRKMGVEDRFAISAACQSDQIGS